MYNVLDVCKYIINFSNEKDYGVSNLKLQKLLYFIQAYFLLNNNGPCFIESIEAWDFGPVIPVAYEKYKQYGSTDIPSTKSNISGVNKGCIADCDKKLINKVITKLSNCSATDLVWITQNQTPWQNAYIPYQDNEITIESLRKYFVNYSAAKTENPPIKTE